MPEYEGVCYDLVLDGKVMRDNLKILEKDYNWLVLQLEPYNIKPEEALIVTIDGKGNFFCQAKERNK